MKLTVQALEGILSDATSGTMDHFTVNLYSAYDGTQEPSPSNFTAPTYSGYSHIPSLTWNGPRVWPDGSVGYFKNVSFQAADADPQQSDSVLGFYLTSGSSVLGFEAFPSPVPMVDATSFCNFEIKFSLDESADYGDSTQE